MKTFLSLLALAQTLLCLLTSPSLHAAADLYIKDTPADTGIEPNPDAGPMWITQDIWVRNNADPGHQPYPFPEATPPWVPLAHQNPEYRDPKYSLPSYVYVRVRNRGNTASSGTERLKVYWAKASTGLSWPAQWSNYLAATCGPQRLYGAEITRPRKNAATATAAERNAYRDAVAAIGTVPAYLFPGGVSYFDKQDQVHENAPGIAHSSAAFTPWHREMMNRYEVLLQHTNPTVSLLYWDWTTDPENSTGGFNFFTGSFMGNSGRGTGGVLIGPPFNALFPPSVTRALSSSTTPSAISDASVLGVADYQPFRSNMEVFAHNGSHGYIGGGGNMSFLNTAAEDPFFFLLHGNVDRLWAQWQRDPANLGRLDPATAYGLDGGASSINNNMAPWNGTGSIQPWTVADGYIVNKSPKHPSIVTPPVYDLAPLRIPVLQPGQAVVLQIPWHPPNPAEFACFGADQGHVCLLARVETTTNSPFGMTFPETADVNGNTRNNNNIAWKNITVVDNLPGASLLASIIIRNPGLKALVAGLTFQHAGDFSPTIFDFGRLTVDLRPDLFKRWTEAGRGGQGVEVVGESTLQFFSPRAFIAGIPLRPGEFFSVDVRFTLDINYRPLRGQTIDLDLIQLGTPEDPGAIVGGQRFTVDISKLTPVKRGASWKFWDANTEPGADWNQPGFNDERWEEGLAELGFGDDPVTHLGRRSPVDKLSTVYFRRTFPLDEPSIIRDLVLLLKRDDGAAVYLNGREVHRVNLPAGRLGHETLATSRVEGLAEEVFWPTDLSPFVGLLRRGENVLAVEVHQGEPDPRVPPTQERPDFSFDLELCANLADRNLPPQVTLTHPPDGAYLLADTEIGLRAEAIDPDGKTLQVAFFDGDELIGSLSQPPYEIAWKPSARRHRIRVAAVDDAGARGSAFATINVLRNPPPLVDMLTPADGESLQSGNRVQASASAADLGGKIQKVEFLLRRGHRFTDPFQPVGSSDTPPYAVVLPPLPAGHYAIQAEATDDEGLTSLSSPTHFEVLHGSAPELSIELMGNHMMLMWEAAGMVLERAPQVTGPWREVLDAKSPLMLMPDAKQAFFRLRTP